MASLHWSDPNLLSGSLVWKIYPPASDDKVGSFTLPDGTQAQARSSGGTLRIDGTSPASRPYEVVVWMKSAPQGVLLNSKPLAGWRFDTLTHQLHAVFVANQFHLELSGGTF